MLRGKAAAAVASNGGLVQIASVQEGKAGLCNLWKSPLQLRLLKLWETLQMRDPQRSHEEATLQEVPHRCSQVDVCDAGRPWSGGSGHRC